MLLGTHADILSKYLPKEKQCLELFARNLLPGWTSWGNEVMWTCIPPKHCYWSVLALKFLQMIPCYQLKIGMFHQHLTNDLNHYQSQREELYALIIIVGQRLARIGLTKRNTATNLMVLAIISSHLLLHGLATHIATI